MENRRAARALARADVGERMFAINLIERQNMSIAAVARHIGRNRETVSTWWHRYNEEGHLRDRHGGGRPRALTEDQEEAIVLLVERQPIVTAPQIKAELQLDCSEETIRRVLRRRGLRARVAADRALLSPANVAARLAFARQHLAQHDVQFWRRVVFTDEKTFDTSKHGRQIVYRRVGERFRPENVARRQRSGRVSVHVWGWIDGNGRGTLHRIGGRFNAAAYLTLIRDSFLPAIRHMRDPPILMMQDNSPVHTARIVREFFAAEADVTLLPWVARGPDMNPIENVWGFLTSELTPRLRDRRVTAEELWLEIQQCWERVVTPAYCRRLAESVPRRMREVVDNGGQWSGY